MSAETTSNVVERMKGRGAGADRPRVVFRTDWKRATRRLIVGGLCAVTAASLTFPSAAMAAEWVNVGGTQYDAAAGDEAHTWSWDGANDMQLNGYNGGPIEAAGRLDLTYEGGNTVTNDSGEGISVVNGVNEKAELNITGGASDSLTVDATSDAIESQGDINISGDGTVNSTASRADGIDAEGNLTISGGGTVSATGSSDGIEVGGNATIDTSGNVVAKGGSNNGLDVNNGSLTISGGGNVTASSENDEAVAVDGDLSISGGSRLEASSENDEAVVVDGNLTMSGGSRLEASSEMRTGLLVEGALSAVDSTLVASGTCEGLYVYKGVTFDHATVRVAARNPGNEAFGLFTDEDDIVIRNGSVVEAFAEGAYSAGIYTQNCEEGGAGGRMFVSESVVRAVARYLEGEGQDGGDIAMNYASADVDGDEQLGRNAGIVVLTKNGMSPAKLSIVRSTVTAEGDTAAILVCATSEDGSVAGMIELEGSIIQTPAGGHVSDYNAKHEVRDGVEYDVGQTIGLSGETITSLDSADIAKSAVIVPEEVPVPAPSGSSTSGGANVTQATARKTSVAGSAIPQTGDASLTGVLSAGFAGLAALVSGLFVSRKRG
ncbi:LPXTG cell wall anchor domain-containing protein [uncultured Parolsenella sp.]|uniref:LPXTG cell wall anchor domain-containing protein n=1 Tax=uncultured Parolsenella sp. TaxID=2083008 RepID=UPI002598FF28|nr:LPXTG cell wall anchor domain-containing protein [uncultured Parolsenella sp.]